MFKVLQQNMGLCSWLYPSLAFAWQSPRADVSPKSTMNCPKGWGECLLFPPALLQIGQQPICALRLAPNAGCQQGVSQLSLRSPALACSESRVSAAFLLQMLHPLPAVGRKLTTPSRGCEHGCALWRGKRGPAILAACWLLFRIWEGEVSKFPQPKHFSRALGLPCATRLPLADVFLSQQQRPHPLRHLCRREHREVLPGMGLFPIPNRIWLVYWSKWCWLVRSWDPWPFRDHWERVLSYPLRPGTTNGATGTRRKSAIS